MNSEIYSAYMHRDRVPHSSLILMNDVTALQYLDTEVEDVI